MSTILLVILVLLLLGALPAWPHSRGWGWSPVGVIVILIVIWLLFGHRL